MEGTMDLGHPIGSIVPALDARVLEVLSGTTRPLAGREIGRIIGKGSVNGVWNALNRLEGQGVILADHRSGATYYIANREHLAWPAIETLTRLRADLTARIGQEIERWEVGALHASIFGSTARGDAGRSSDVDLLLVQPGSLDDADAETWDEQVASLRDVVQRWTGNRCQTFIVDTSRLEEYVRAQDPLVRAWLEDGILLSGAPIRDLLEAGR
jgi:predicted nucleotidyltransferase